METLLELYYSSGTKPSDSDVDDIVTFFKIPKKDLPLKDGYQMTNTIGTHEITVEWNSPRLFVKDTYKRDSLSPEYKSVIVSLEYEVVGLSLDLTNNTASILDAKRSYVPITK